MCTDGSGNSVICGPRWQVRTLIDEYWPQLDTARRFGLRDQRPRLLDLAELDERFNDAESPAVAIVEHQPGEGIPLTRHLQVELVVGNRQFGGMPELICEPGYPFAGTHGGAHAAGPPAPRVHLYDPRIAYMEATLATLATLPLRGGRNGGTRVALLDSGVDPGQVDLGQTQPEMIDFIGAHMFGVRRTQTVIDPLGHGTAMAMIIKALSPRTVITPLRVINAQDQAECFEVLIALQYALYSEQFDYVTACLAAPARTPCPNSLGRSIEWMLGYTCKQPHIRVPKVIAAGGNHGPSRQSQYLAQMAGVLVARANDETGNLAGYNSNPPPHAYTHRTYGGTRDQPVGTVGGQPLYGTSVAAAALTGALVRP